MNLIVIGRIVAAGVAVSTFVFLFLHDSWRSDNLFLVPDLILIVALLVSAILPVRFAVSAMVGSLSLAAGVFATSAASYAVRDEFGGASLAGAAATLVMAGLLARRSSLGSAPGRPLRRQAVMK